MKITHRILSLPPYVSTSWREVQSIHQQGNELIVSLMSGDSVHIPNLPKETLDQIYAVHAIALEEQAQEEQFELSRQISEASVFPLENISGILHHNPAQASAPPLPPDMIEKIASIAKAVVPEDAEQLPKAEPHCNCPYCQIVRAITGTAVTEEVEEEPVADQELQFQQWDVVQTGDKLFTVSNRLDTKESYNVFLGEPIGCTCGSTNCEHLLAVLQT